MIQRASCKKNESFQQAIPPFAFCAFYFGLFCGVALIQETDSWKGRGYRSFVFAAPIEIAGTRVFVAAVVDQRPDNKFYLNEVVDSTGNFVRIKEIPIDGTKSGFTEKNGITATPMEISGQQTENNQL